MRSCYFSAFYLGEVFVVAVAIGGLPAVLSVPNMGVAKVMFDNTHSLKPLGYMLGKDGDEEGLRT